MDGHDLIMNRFEIVEQLGRGSFGVVHRALDRETKEEVAMKLESRLKNHRHRLFEEKNFYQKLHGGLGIPHVMWYGNDEFHNILVLDLLGPSLQQLFEHCNRRFSEKTILMLANQMIRRLRDISRLSVVHRDIKPDNFLMGVAEGSSLVHLVDFGLAADYNPAVAARSTRSGLTGTPRYASVNAHQGSPASPRDDMESLLYTLMYFLRGYLPWQFVEGETQGVRTDKMRDWKMNATVESITAGLPWEYGFVLRHCRELEYKDEPDYVDISAKFMQLFRARGYVFDFAYDWCT